MTSGIVQKLIGGLALILVVLALVMGVFFSSREGRIAQGNLERFGGVAIELASKIAQTGLGLVSDTEGIREAVAPFGGVPDLAFLNVYNATGEIVVAVSGEGKANAVRIDPDKPGVQITDAYLLFVAKVRAKGDGEEEDGGTVVGSVAIVLDRSSVWDAISEARSVTFGFGLAMLFVGCMLFYLVARRMVAPIAATVVRLQDIAEGEGDLTQRLEITSTDEIGRLGSAFNLFVDKLQNSMQSLGGNIGSVMEASRELNGISGDLETTTISTSEESFSASEGTEKMSEHVESAAAGVSQMSEAIDKVSAEVVKVSDIARMAVDSAQSTTASVKELEESTSEINSVLRTISSIAEQTNLLALNATIEAARAGDAGKGFAVVANEVKELAKETAKATEDVRKLVGSIATSSHATVDAISSIRNVIEEIDRSQEGISLSVQEQSIAASTVADSVQQANYITKGIAKSIRDVAMTAQGNAEYSTQLLNSAQSMATTADKLNEIVQQFRY
ncbi:MAG: methyl-accepting chemotaxis protein [Myxococcota bacterium]|nr:methyl-accepting chemotaxis protein [Myxococcota bacterium]